MRSFLIACAFLLVATNVQAATLAQACGAKLGFYGNTQTNAQMADAQRKQLRECMAQQGKAQGGGSAPVAPVRR